MHQIRLRGALPLLLALAACRRAEQPQQTSGYADPKACGQCHAALAASYQKTGMGRSIGLALAENAPATVTHEPSGLAYAISNREGALVVRREEAGGENILEHQADYAIGSGNHARSYLRRNHEGMYMEFPVTWYAANGGHWAMSPGFEHAQQQDFRRAVTGECLFCHASYNQRLQSIDCQRCHGPGAAHAYSGGRNPILNPKKLSRDLQLDVCQQCHLQTTSAPLPNAIRRFGRELNSYRPGEPLAEYALHFDHAPGRGFDGKFEIAHQAYRLRQSACFQKSEMTCGTCHDAHTVQRGAAAARCQQCHAQPHHPETTCVECHMPRRPTTDAPHVAVTDHFIRRPGKPAPAPVPPKSYLGPVVPYYPATLPGAEGEAYLAVAQVRHGANLPAGIPQLEAALAKLLPADPAFYVEVAQANATKGDYAAAVRWYDEALKREQANTPALRGLAASLIALKQFDRAAALLAQVTRPDAATLSVRGQALLELGRLDEADRILRQAAATNPDLPEPHLLLGQAALRRHDPQTAETEFRQALQRQPDFAAAHASLADLLAARNDSAGAQKHRHRATGHR